MDDGWMDVPMHIHSRVPSHRRARRASAVRVSVDLLDPVVVVGSARVKTANGRDAERKGSRDRSIDRTPRRGLEQRSDLDRNLQTSVVVGSVALLDWTTR